MKIFIENGLTIATPTEKDEYLNSEFCKQHPEIDIIRGCTWDIETEKHIHNADIVNYYSKKIGHPSFREKLK